MSQKFKKLQNTNDDSTAFGKWFATAVYDQHFIETEQLADFIQTQASVKKSDIKAVLDELGSAMKHFFELGQKVRLDGIGIFKVGFSSIGVNDKDDCGAQNITTRRVLCLRVSVWSSVRPKTRTTRSFRSTSSSRRSSRMSSSRRLMTQPSSPSPIPAPEANHFPS